MARKKRSAQRKSNNVLRKLLNFVAWLTGIVVSLAVGFAMVGGTLTIPYWLGGNTVAMIAGWVVIVSTFIGIVMAIFNR